MIKIYFDIIGDINDYIVHNIFFFFQNNLFIFCISIPFSSPLFPLAPSAFSPTHHPSTPKWVCGLPWTVNKDCHITLRQDQDSVHCPVPRLSKVFLNKECSQKVNNALGINSDSIVSIPAKPKPHTTTHIQRT